MYKCTCDWGLIRISTIPLVTAHPPALLPLSSYNGHFSLVYLPCGEKRLVISLWNIPESILVCHSSDQTKYVQHTQEGCKVASVSCSPNSPCFVYDTNLGTM